MEKLFVPYELALKLKEKGCEINCLAMFSERYCNGKLSVIGQHEGSSVYGDSNINFEGLDYKVVTAPTIQQVQDFLRENHDIDVWAKKDWDGGVIIGYSGYVDYRDGMVETDTFKTYNESILEAIKEALNLI